MEQKGDRKKYPVSASDYELLEEVGQGVSAIVHRATCIPLKETVAIKVLDLEKCNSNLDEIRREAQTMSLIDHPNVLRAHCSFVVEQSLWVVMPYMAGGSCLHIMKSAFPDGFDETVIATILRECLKALEYLHGHGHIHRDVKAGNILVDANGVVKLGDFGVSACMFDTGDRQRSRNTFVGTPCWMAPEVMEQLHGYDFKADIWSFGITALELAHGHAPFSKYPPMKVLLMTLQNAPPGLDYERDKRFSKSFKEMIAMCLVKDPAKRPTAEKLLRHSFFKRARTHDYIARVVLDGLPPLGQRLRELKMKDADMLAQKKMPFGEKEERSQSEYKRGVSGWNFDIEDLKAQASLNQDDYEPQVGKDDMEQSKRTCSPGDSDNSLLEIVCHLQPPLSQHFNKMSTDDYHLPVTIHSLRAESRTDAGEHVTRIRSGPLPAPVQLSAGGSVKYISDSIVDDMDGNVPLCNDHTSSPQQPGLAYVKENQRKECQLMGKPDERDWRIEKVHREGRRASSGPLVPEYVLASYRCREDERDRDRQSTSSLQRDRTHSGPLTSYGASPDYRFTNGIPGPSKPSSGTKEGSEKGLYVQKKGRFSVTSEDVDLVEGPSRVTRKSASLQAFPQLSLNSHPSPPASSGTMSVSATTILPHLQNILQQTISQQEIISNLIDSISQCEAPNAQCLSHLGSKHLSRNSSIGNRDPLVNVSSERERELLQHVAELQSRLASLVDELQAIKLRNVSLERQLNAIYNKEEEERIRREEAAKEDN